MYEYKRKLVSSCNTRNNKLFVVIRILIIIINKYNEAYFGWQ